MISSFDCGIGSEISVIASAIVVNELFINKSPSETGDILVSSNPTTITLRHLVAAPNSAASTTMGTSTV